jgi:hypothetical protein
MLLIAISAFLWSLAFAGWGLFVFRSALAGLGHRSGEMLALSILVGHLPVLAVGFLIHLVSPLSSLVAGCVLIAGIALLIVERRALGLRALLGAYAPILLVVSAFASRPIVHGDSGYYAIPAINWFVSEPVVRGLANLDPTFGHNSSWWILAGFQSGGVGLATGVLAVSVPFLAAVGVIVGSGLRDVLRGERGCGAWFLVPALYLWIRQVVGVNTPSPSTDVPANLSTVLAFWLMVRVLDANRRESSHGKRSPGRFVPSIFEPLGVLFLAIAVLAFSAKLSAALVLVIAALWGLASMFRAPNFVASIRKNWVGLSVMALLVMAQIFHGFLLSGFPFFPSGFGGWFDVPWRVDPTLPAATVERAREWAQTFGASAQQIAEVPRWRLWIERQGALTNLIIAVLLALAGMFGGGYVIYKNKKEALNASFLLLPAMLAAGLLIWNLYHAPALRFGAGYAFAVLGCLTAFAGPLVPKRQAVALAAVWVILCVGSLAPLAFSRPLSLVMPSPMPTSVFDERKTEAGEPIFVPTDGFAWVGPLPSCPSFEFNSQLEVIRSPVANRIIGFKNPLKRKTPSSLP